MNSRFKNEILRKIDKKESTYCRDLNQSSRSLGGCSEIRGKGVAIYDEP